MPHIGEMTDPKDTIEAIAVGYIPASTFEKAKNAPFRDALIAYMARCYDKEKLATVLVYQVQTVQSISTYDQIALIELAATAAYMAGDMTVTKDVLMRVPAQHATKYMKTLHHAIALLNWDSSQFINEVERGANQAISAWTALQ
jgi:hypothetical protein